MTTPAGWYPDPSGHPFERYWSGGAWTQQTRGTWQVGCGKGNGGHRAPLTSDPYRSPRSWYRRKRCVIPAAIVGAFIVIGVIGSALDAAKKDPANNALGGGPASFSQTSPPPTDDTTSPESSSTPAAGSDGSFIMPDEVGTVLQDAQDDIQRVSGDQFFFTDSHDALGSSRFQILDRDWQVCSQNVAAGQAVGAGGNIDFAAVKLDETCP